MALCTLVSHSNVCELCKRPRGAGLLSTAKNTVQHWESPAEAVQLPQQCSECQQQGSFCIAVTNTSAVLTMGSDLSQCHNPLLTPVRAGIGAKLPKSERKLTQPLQHKGMGWHRGDTVTAGFVPGSTRSLAGWSHNPLEQGAPKSAAQEMPGELEGSLLSFRQWVKEEVTPSHRHSHLLPGPSTGWMPQPGWLLKL